METSYAAVKTQVGSNVPVLVRPAVGAAPRIVARYDGGDEVAIDAANMNETAVKATVDSL